MAPTPNPTAYSFAPPHPADCHAERWRKLTPYHDSIVGLSFEPTAVGLVAFDGSEPPSASTADYQSFAVHVGTY